jgi:hypothetical protein
MMLDPRIVARALGGSVSGRNVVAPGPGHSRADRSLSIKIDPAAPDGFVVHSFAGDPPITCRASSVAFLRRLRPLNVAALARSEPADEVQCLVRGSCE